MVFKIPSPRECLNCGHECYARDWCHSTTTGRPYGGDLVKVYWQCSYCGRRFQTMEHLENILETVDELPEALYKTSYIEENEDEEDG